MLAKVLSLPAEAEESSWLVFFLLPLLNCAKVFPYFAINMAALCNGWGDYF